MGDTIQVVMYGLAGSINVWRISVVCVLIGFILLVALMIWDHNHDD